MYQPYWHVCIMRVQSAKNIAALRDHILGRGQLLQRTVKSENAHNINYISKKSTWAHQKILIFSRFILLWIWAFFWFWFLFVSSVVLLHFIFHQYHSVIWMIIWTRVCNVHVVCMHEFVWLACDVLTWKACASAGIFGEHSILICGCTNVCLAGWLLCVCAVF